MVIDHLCKIVFQWLLSDYWWGMINNGQMSQEQFYKIDNFIRFDLQSIGTIAFPLFCFLLAEGFQHTRNKKRYIGLMFAFALISEIPFDMGFFSRYSLMEGTFPFYLKYQNVFFTLFLGLLTLVCLERLSCKSEIRTEKIKSVILQVICVAVLALVAELIRCDYGMQGILYIAAFYVCRNCSATSFLRNWDSILEKKRANLRSISEPARLRQPPPQKHGIGTRKRAGSKHTGGATNSRPSRAFCPLVGYRLLSALYGPFCGPLRPFGGCPWGVTPSA